MTAHAAWCSISCATCDCGYEPDKWIFTPQSTTLNPEWEAWNQNHRATPAAAADLESKGWQAAVAFFRAGNWLKDDAPVWPTPAAAAEPGEVAMLIERDCCESEAADPEDANTICINIADLRTILENRLATPAAAAEPGVPDSVWEALQRMIEDGLNKGPASRDDALAVARHRDRVRLLATPAAAAEPSDEDIRRPKP
jgi:hypothetical protein